MSTEPIPSAIDTTHPHPDYVRSYSRSTYAQVIVWVLFAINGILTFVDLWLGDEMPRTVMRSFGITWLFITGLLIGLSFQWARSLQRHYESLDAKDRQTFDTILQMLESSSDRESRVRLELANQTEIQQSLEQAPSRAVPVPALALASTPREIILSSGEYTARVVNQDGRIAYIPRDIA